MENKVDKMIMRAKFYLLVKFLASSMKIEDKIYLMKTLKTRFLS